MLGRLLSQAFKFGNHRSALAFTVKLRGQKDLVGAQLLQFQHLRFKLFAGVLGLSPGLFCGGHGRLGVRLQLPAFLLVKTQAEQTPTRPPAIIRSIF